MVVNKEIKGLHDSRILEELDGASPRATVIVGAAAIERLLDQLIDKYKTHIKSNPERIINMSPSFTTFSSKIKAVYHLNLVSKKTYEDLNRVRVIRNNFAHELFDCTFDNDDVINIIRNFNYGPQMFKYVDGRDIQPRFLFILELQVIAFSIIRQITRCKPLKDLTGNEDDWGLEQIDYEWLNSK